ncbi:unnamed protein product [Symbiodinium natans]|uniref:Uncharacterized protein n=1 Tax=Symbiodinium natans TaxID=878477 RepID=A0A812QQ00_9DINO|nr:unnamed protein product [Symbiodinium natans]
MVVDSRCKARLGEQAAPKEELQFSTEVIATYGFALRLNHIVMRCDHKDKSTQRRAKDTKAANLLKRTWKGAFVTTEKGSSEVKLQGGKRLAMAANPCVVDAIDQVIANLPSKVFGENIGPFINQVSARVKRSRELKEAAFATPAKSKAQKRKRRAASRGAAVTHTKRSPGRKKASSSGITRTPAEMQALCKAWKRLNKEAAKCCRKVRTVVTSFHLV